MHSPKCDLLHITPPAICYSLWLRCSQLKASHHCFTGRKWFPKCAAPSSREGFSRTYISTTECRFYCSFINQVIRVIKCGGIWKLACTCKIRCTLVFESFICKKNEHEAKLKTITLKHLQLFNKSIFSFCWQNVS